MTNLAKYLHIDPTPSQVVRISAVVVLIQAAVTAQSLLRAANVVAKHEEKFLFLMDVANRNIDPAQLDEFDKIALYNLGMIRDK